MHCELDVRIISLKFCTLAQTQQIQSQFTDLMLFPHMLLGKFFIQKDELFNKILYLSQLKQAALKNISLWNSFSKTNEFETSMIKTQYMVYMVILLMLSTLFMFTCWDRKYPKLCWRNILMVPKRFSITTSNLKINSNFLIACRSPMKTFTTAITEFERWCESQIF